MYLEQDHTSGTWCNSSATYRTSRSANNYMYTRRTWLCKKSLDNVCKNNRWAIQYCMWLSHRSSPQCSDVACMEATTVIIASFVTTIDPNSPCASLCMRYIALKLEHSEFEYSNSSKYIVRTCTCTCIYIGCTRITLEILSASARTRALEYSRIEC